MLLFMVKGPNMSVFFDALACRQPAQFAFFREGRSVVRRLRVVGVTTVNQHHEPASEGCWFIQLRDGDGCYYNGTYDQNTCKGQWTKVLGPPTGGREL